MSRRQASTAWCSISACPRCRSTRPNAVSPSCATGRSTCAWRRPGVSAADVVNRAKPSDLTRIFGILGEERHAGRIARAIEAERAKRPFSTTRQLAGLIEKVSPRRPQDKIHPATRVFQALRTYVNDELGELATALFAAEKALKPAGGWWW
jgi:16S rRNA C1402 N4-methylase RsmH